MKICLTSGQHPQANGQVDVMNRWIAQRLRPFTSYYQDDWDDFLPVLNFASASLPSETTGMSPFMVERGYEPRMAVDWQQALEGAKLSVNKQQAQKMVQKIEEP
jgi:hypothetical protein